MSFAALFPDCIYPFRGLIGSLEFLRMLGLTKNLIAFQ